MTIEDARKVVAEQQTMMSLMEGTINSLSKDVDDLVELERQIAENIGVIKHLQGERADLIDKKLECIDRINTLLGR